MANITARLDRTDTGTPWGFRLYGGKDFGVPLTIQRVTPGSLAHKCGLLVGDAITRIGGQPTEPLRHKDAQQRIIGAGNSLDLALHRLNVSMAEMERLQASGGAMRAGPPAAAPQQPAYQQQPQQQPYQAAPPGPAYGGGQGFDQDYNRTAAPFSPAGAAGAPGGVPVAVNNQYNTPLNLYSPDSAIDSLAKQTGLMQVGGQPAPSGGGGGGGYSAPAPAAAPSHAPAHAPSPAGSWQPRVPTGPRKMLAGRAGEAKSMPMPSGTQRIPVCNSCGIAIRGPFVLALDKTWCPNHFNCSNPQCAKPLIGVGFIEEDGQLLCESDYERFLAPRCGKCGNSIMRECVNALNNTFHPDCFLCSQCGCAIGSGSFHIEDGKNFCEKDWQAMFQTKCYGCQFPIEPGDRWVDALNENWHSECFNCSTCQVNLEGQGFYAKNGKPYCKKHAKGGKAF